MTYIIPLIFFLFITSAIFGIPKSEKEYNKFVFVWVIWTVLWLTNCSGPDYSFEPDYKLGAPRY